MKNTLKYLLLIAISICMLILLTGCGNKTIYAIKSDSDETIGNYDIALTINFEKDTISNVKVDMTFEEESIAEFITSGNNGSSIQFEREGNTITCDLSTEEYKEAYGIDFSTMSRAEIIEELETEGYTIQDK